VLDPKHLLWLAEIADLGSMTRAAQKLHVTQPTLTRAVQIIEDQIGSKVFERERNGVRPTLIGERLVEVGREILQERARADDIIDLWREGLDRELRIGVGPMMAASVAGDFFATLVMDRPRYSTRVVSATATGLIKRLNGKELDIVLAPEQINLFQDDLVQHKLLEDELAVFAGAQNQIHKTRHQVDEADLESYPWIAIGALSGIYGSTKEVLRDLKVRRVAATINFTGDVVMAAEILRKTDALCVVPRYLARMSKAFSGIEPVNFSGKLPKRNIVLWARRTDYSRPDILDFHERLRNYLGGSKVLLPPPAASIQLSKLTSCNADGVGRPE